MHQLAMIHTLQPARAQAAGEGQLQAPAQLVGGGRLPRGLGLDTGLACRLRQGIEPLAVGLRNCCHIGGLLEAPFDLEAGDPNLGQLRQQLPGGQILGREQVALLAQVPLHPIDNQLIGKPASLGAFAPVGTALAQGLAGEALARIGHTEGPMHEHFQGHDATTLLELVLEACKILEAQFPGQHHSLAAQFGRMGHAGSTGD